MKAPAPLHPTVATQRFRHRRGRCYELTVTAMLRMESHEWTLVHGVIHTPLPIGHAWLERGPLVWDPLENQEFSLDEYGHRFGAEAIACWRLKQMAEQIIQDGTYGPWVEYPMGTMYRSKTGELVTT
jgi:hypothetical protein